MTQVSRYLKGDEKYPDLGYKNRLTEHSQKMNPKPGYVPPEPVQQHPSEWKVTFHTVKGEHTVHAHGIYLDAVISRAVAELPYGLRPEEGQPLTITFTAAK